MSNTTEKMPLITLENVTKTFRTGLTQVRPVLHDVNLTVCAGDFVVLRGANGAGKSTLLKLILGLQIPDSGKVHLFGLPPSEPASKLGLGTVFQEVTPPTSLKVKELLTLVGRYYPTARSADEMLETVELTDKQHAYPSNLSGGEKQRLYFAIALIGNPQLLILDEPTKNLDADGQAAFWQQIEACYQRGVTILMVTHIKAEQAKLNHLATRILTLSDGQLTAEKALPLPAVEVAHTHEQQSDLLSPPPLPYKMLIAQSQIEILQLIRNPVYLLGVGVLSGLGGLFVSLGMPGIAGFSALTLLILSVERSGRRIAIERLEGWLKLLRVTPLSPTVYILAKLLTTLTVLLGSLSITFAISIFQGDLSQTFSQWLLLGASLLLGIIPFSLLGIALGYWVSPKSLDAITGLLIPLAIFSSGLLNVFEQSYINDLIVLLPFFHYREIIQAAIGLNYDHQLVLHCLWLAFYACVTGYVAKLAYQSEGTIL